jgi:hypothetical protein
MPGEFLAKACSRRLAPAELNSSINGYGRRSAGNPIMDGRKVTRGNPPGKPTGHRLTKNDFQPLVVEPT